ncbi:hypothetical protein IWQ62_004209 [Dispira parvispora]|uniref:Uncharacterized protein n=1 Tax=Dispira parvispora TaxID=1520584 RepID=A0A9W8APH7_9FUNG|nr:hypothetical protein IWQ62_004209 [Dispira parvispora]
MEVKYPPPGRSRQKTPTSPNRIIKVTTPTATATGPVSGGPGGVNKPSKFKSAIGSHPLSSSVSMPVSLSGGGGHSHAPSTNSAYHPHPRPLQHLLTSPSLIRPPSSPFGRSFSNHPSSHSGGTQVPVYSPLSPSFGQGHAMSASVTSQPTSKFMVSGASTTVSTILTSHPNLIQAGGLPSPLSHSVNAYGVGSTGSGSSGAMAPSGSNKHLATKGSALMSPRVGPTSHSTSAGTNGTVEGPGPSVTPALSQPRLRLASKNANHLASPKLTAKTSSHGTGGLLASPSLAATSSSTVGGHYSSYLTTPTTTTPNGTSSIPQTPSSATAPSASAHTTSGNFPNAFSAHYGHNSPALHKSLTALDAKTMTREISSTLTDMANQDDPWSVVCANTLPLFNGDEPNKSIEELGHHIRSCMHSFKSPALFIHEIRQLLTMGTLVLYGKLQTIPDDRFLSKLAEIWLVLSRIVLPRVEAIFLPLRTETLAPNFNFYQPYDLRRDLLLCLRDTTLLPCTPRIEAALSLQNQPYPSSSVKPVTFLPRVFQMFAAVSLLRTDDKAQTALEHTWAQVRHCVVRLQDTE